MQPRQGNSCMKKRIFSKVVIPATPSPQCCSSKTQQHEMIHQAKETFHVVGNGDTFTAKQNTWTADMLLHAAPCCSHSFPGSGFVAMSFVALSRHQQEWICFEAASQILTGFSLNCCRLSLHPCMQGIPECTPMLKEYSTSAKLQLQATTQKLRNSGSEQRLKNKNLKKLTTTI